MKRPSKLGTTLLSIFLIASGAMHILEVGSRPAYVILNIVAVAAGVMIWLDK